MLIPLVMFFFFLMVQEVYQKAMENRIAFRYIIPLCFFISNASEWITAVKYINIYACTYGGFSFFFKWYIEHCCSFVCQNYIRRTIAVLFNPLPGC